jgi:hypothetical protein
VDNAVDELVLLFFLASTATKRPLLLHSLNFPTLMVSFFFSGKGASELSPASLCRDPSDFLSSSVTPNGRASKIR